MKLSEAVALFERCMSDQGDLFGPLCEGCPLNLQLGDPEEDDAYGVAYTINPCSFLQVLEQVLKDKPMPRRKGQLPKGKEQA